MRLNGYSTAAYGKWHETAAWETSISGPTDRWPNRQGFDEFYGFIGGETNQWAPYLFHGQAPVELPNDPKYHFLTDMTDKAIAWVEFQKAMTPDKPFFVYYAPGATHAPHHVPAEWIAKWKGKFDQGWDALREETLARQITLGVVPPGTKLAPKPEAIKDWNALSADEKRLFARQMEVYAAYLDMTDFEVGRLVKGIEQIGPSTTHSSSTSSETTAPAPRAARTGCSTIHLLQRRARTGAADAEGDGHVGLARHIPAHGVGVGGGVGYAVHVDQAGGVQLRRHAKRHGGPLAEGDHGRRRLRSQFHHVIDVAPTVLEAAKLPEPKIVNGTPQIPMEGVSMAYSFDNADGEGPAPHAVLRDLREPGRLSRRLARGHGP